MNNKNLSNKIQKKHIFFGKNKINAFFNLLYRNCFPFLDSTHDNSNKISIKCRALML